MSCQGGAVASGGLRELIPAVARACVAVGIDGIFMEVSTAMGHITQQDVPALQDPELNTAMLQQAARLRLTMTHRSANAWH